MGIIEVWDNIRGEEQNGEWFGKSKGMKKRFYNDINVKCLSRVRGAGKTTVHNLLKANANLTVPHNLSTEQSFRPNHQDYRCHSIE